MVRYMDEVPTPEVQQGDEVERVARAMFDADDHHPDLWDALNWEGPEDYRRRARAALAALPAGMEALRERNGGDRAEFVTEMFLHFTYQVAAFSNDPALVQRAAEFHYQFGRHIPTPRPGGCEPCKEDAS